MAKRIEYNYYHDGKSITRSAFLSGIGGNSENWRKKCVRDRFGSWHYGSYRADPKD